MVATKRKKKEQKPQVLKNHVFLVIDSSGSMYQLVHDVKQTYKQWMNDIRSESIKHGQDTTLSLITFADKVYEHYILENIQDVDTRNFDYITNGLTALLDAVGHAIKKGKNIRDDEASYLVVVITDGGENASRHTTAGLVAKDIIDLQKQGNWSFVFMVPPGHKQITSKLGVPDDNIREWKPTRKAFKTVSQETSLGISGYYAARSVGHKMSSSFFATTDLSSVKASDLKKNLDNIASECKIYNVNQESVIREFVESKTSKPYVLGTTFYQLMKKEKVQANKEILVVPKGKKTEVWAGDAARQMIGLPIGVDCKVEPGNHSGFDVYIQSTSVNRILSRGSKIIIRTI